MELEELKTWQWVLAGLIAGALFSCVVAWTGPKFDTQDRDTIEQGEFENGTIESTQFGQITGSQGRLIDLYHKGQPLLRDVTAHPPISSDPTHYWVTGRFYFIGLKPVDSTKANSPLKVFEEWRLFKFPAAIPYVPGYTLREQKKLDKNAASRRNVQLADLKKELGGQSTFPTVVEYLKAARSLPGNDFRFQYAWWELPQWRWTLPPLAGLLMIGIAWPLALTVMQNYGLAKPAQVKTKPKTKPAPAKKPAMTAMPTGVVLRPAVPAPPPKPTEVKEYGGEFYPVVKATHKE